MAPPCGDTLVGPEERVRPHRPGEPDLGERLAVIGPSRMAAFSADRNVARTRSTVAGDSGVPLLVRSRQACRSRPAAAWR